VDAICKEMGKSVPCATAEKLLPFPREYSFHDLESRLGRISGAGSSSEILCECELVTRGEILEEIKNLPFPTLKEVQERTRAGMGPCQEDSVLPADRSPGGNRKIHPGTSLAVLKKFLEERWKGTRPVLWGPSLRKSS